MTGSKHVFSLGFGILALIGSSCVDAFCDRPATLPRTSQRSGSYSSPIVYGFLDDVGKFFDGLGDGQSSQSDEGGVGDEDDDECTYAGSTRIITIPAESMKVGGLRLFCSLYLMGLQNTPEPGAWKAHQSDNMEVNLRYQDLSGSVIVEFREDGITVDRLGSSPSQKYLMHESIVLNGFLDQLNTIVHEGDVDASNRLLTLPAPGDAIEKAREVVAFA